MDKTLHRSGDGRVLPDSPTGVGGVAVAHVDQYVDPVQHRGVGLHLVETDELHVVGGAGQGLDHSGIGVVLLLVQGVVDHVAAPGPGPAPAVQHGHPLHTVGGGALDVVIQLPELAADALHVVDELGELAGQLQVAAVADAVDGFSQNGPAGGDPVLLGLPDGVAPFMEGIGEEVGQEPPLGVLHPGDVSDEPQGGAVTHAPHHRVQADGLELVHVGLGADEVVPQEHHGLLAQLVGDIHHLAGQCGHLPALEGHEVLEFLGGDPVLVVVIALVDDVLGAEFVAHFLLELLQDIGGDRGGVAVPVHILLPLQLVEDQGELVEEGGVPDDIHIGVIRDELAQPLHGELFGLGLADIEGDLVLKVLPVVSDGVVHVDRVPDQVGQKAHRIVVEGLGGVDDHAALLIPPGSGGDRFPRGAVHHLPPALDVVPGVHLHQLAADPPHQRDGQRAARGGVEARHDVALLDLVGVGLGPGVVLPGGVVGGVDLGVGSLQLLRVVGAVAVPDGIRPPALQQLQGLGHHVHIGGDGHPARLMYIGHSFSSHCFFRSAKRAL